MSETRTPASVRSIGSRVRDARGQTTTEYLVLTGMLAAIAVAAFNLLEGSMRGTFQSAAMRVLSVVTGTP
jgi:Flp pilus assembly pilin Flp